MVRFRFGAVLALMLVAAAGCTQVPSGVDKDLVDEWSMMAEAKVPEPAVGACWAATADDVREIVEVTVATTAAKCDGQYSVETVQVGHFTGTVATADRPPGLEQMADVWTTCDAEVTKFLGASWQLGRVRMLVYAPTATQWRGGARFYRCDVASLQSPDGTLERRTTSLKGSLAAGGDHLLGCGVKASEDAWSTMTATACTAPHDVEFVGLVPSKSATEPSGVDALRAAFGDGCLSTLRSYTKASDNTLFNAKAQYGYHEIASGQAEWTVGVRSAQCFLLLPKKITRSVKNNGNTAI